jgi:short-subunit dehydrogenase
MKRTSLKELRDQVIVITGASSGIGLATAEAAARAGAKLVLAARSEHAMNDVVERLRAAGFEAIYVSCDVSDAAQVELVAKAAIERFGRIDTWINNAGLSIYGRLDEVSEADHRRLFDVNFWGVVHGSMAAIPYLRAQGGALINVGSEVSDAFIPLQGMYTASKHAVKGYTDSLRIEIEELDRAPISITLIQPTAVDTPFPQHARNYMDKEPKLPKPRIDPEEVAKAILDAAVHPTRDRKVGALAVLHTAISKAAPAIADQRSAGMAGQQQYDEPSRAPEGALYRPSEETGVIGRTHGTGGKE